MTENLTHTISIQHHWGTCTFDVYLDGYLFATATSIQNAAVIAHGIQKAYQFPLDEELDYAINNLVDRIDKNAKGKRNTEYEFAACPF